MDDNENHLKFSKIYLQQINKDLEIATSTSPKDAIQHLLKEDFDCIISDYQMPELNGIEFAERILSSIEIPFILYTGEGSERVAEQAFKVGISSYLRKEMEPAHYQVLVSTIRNLVTQHKTGEMLQNKTNELDNLVTTSLDIIFTVDMRDKIVRGNPAFQRLFGFTPYENETLGFDLFQYIHEDDLARTRDIIRQLRVLERNQCQCTARWYTKNGEIRYLESSITVIIKDEKVNGFNIISRDITERKQLEIARDRVQSQLFGFMKSATDGFLILDQDFCVQIANQVWLDQAGLTLEEIDGKHITTIFPQLDETNRLSQYRQVQETGNPVEFTKVLPVINLDKYMDIRAFKVGQGIGIITRDITERVKYEEKLERLHKYSDTLTNAKNMAEIADVTVTTVINILECKRVTFKIVEEDKITGLMGYPSVNLEHIYLDTPSITTRAVRTGKPQLIHDTSLDPDFIDGSGDDEKPSLSEYAILIFVDDDPVAVLNLEDPKRNAFTPQRVEIVTILVDHVSAAIKEHQYRRKLESIHTYSNQIASVETTQAIAQVTVNAVNDVLGVTDAMYLQIEDDMFLQLAQSGEKISEQELGSLTYSGIVGRARDTRESQLVPDVRVDPDYRDIWSGTLSELVVPVVLDGKPIAVINLESKKVNRFTVEDQRLVETLAYQISSSIKQITTREQLSILHSHAAVLGSAESINRVAEITQKTIAQILGFSRCSLGLVMGSDLVYNYRGGIEDTEEFRMPLDGPGLTVLAVNSGESIRVGSIPENKVYVDNVGDPVTFSQLAVPIMVSGRAVGIINIETELRDAFSEEDQRLVETLAEHVASALTRIDNIETIINYENRLTALYEHSSLLNLATSIPEIVDVTLEILEMGLGYSYGSIGIVEGDELVSRGVLGAALKGMRLPLDGSGIKVRAVNERRTVLVPNVQLVHGYVSGLSEILSEIVVPLFVSGRVIGVLNIESKQVDSFSENDVQLLKLLAKNVSSRISELEIKDEQKHILQTEELKSNIII